ncbi:MAG: ribosome small subunit-dependent GTPase A [Chitinophagales bacterium]|nr:ribosome small subunit-dependent GTPase A [Chitinophagales bacterium]MCZ2393938.1 ribosome small subunit-dependent GTPase A [Chitinophagales bacterium]
MKARVLQSTGSWYLVKSEFGQLLSCRLPGRFKQEDISSTNPIAVGDEVVVKQDEESRDFVINEILKRKNYIVRQSPRQKHLKHIIASNIDRAILVMTISQPRTSLGFLDRFLVIAEAYHIPITIVVNKTDIFSTKDQLAFNKINEIYTKIGYDIVPISAKMQQGIDIIQSLMNGKTSLLIGHSGVGKSSIVNEINPQLNLKTAKLSNKWNKGTHTTTFATMYEIFENSFIIDTPGIKELFVIEIEPEELGGYFKEIRNYSTKCQYNNCLHENEPNCAVKQAVVDGEIAASRYESYLAILDNIRSVDYWER